MNTGGGHGILKSSLGVSAATLLSRVLGLVRVMLEARVLGGDAIASAWGLAFAIPNTFRRLLGEGALGTALIPLISETDAKSGPEQVRRELGIVFSVLSLILALVVAVVAGGALGLRRLALTGSVQEFLPVLASERVQLALMILPLLMPYAFFICLVGAIGAVLNTRKIFVLPALGALLLNFFLIGGLYAAFRRGLAGTELVGFLEFLSVLVLISGAIQLALMLLLLWKAGRFPAMSRKAFRESGILGRLWRLVLPGMIAGFLREHPGRVRLNLRVANTAEISERLKRNFYDLALVEGPFDERFFLSQKLIDDELLLVGSPRLPVLRSERPELGELFRSGVPLLLRERGAGTRFYFEQFCRNLGVELEGQPQVLTVNNFDAIRAMLREGFGVTVISKFAVREELRNGMLTARRFAEGEIHRSLNFIYLAGDALAFAEEFIAFCRARIRNEVEDFSL